MKANKAKTFDKLDQHDYTMIAFSFHDHNSMSHANATKTKSGARKLQCINKGWVSIISSPVHHHLITNVEELTQFIHHLYLFFLFRAFRYNKPTSVNPSLYQPITQPNLTRLTQYITKPHRLLRTTALAMFSQFLSRHHYRHRRLGY